MRHRKLASTVRILEKFFSKTLDDSVTTDEIYEVWGRQTEDKKVNKAWLSTTLLHLKHHELINPVYARQNNRTALVGIRLTEKGKNILGRKESGLSSSIDRHTSPPGASVSSGQKLGYETMLSLVAKFQSENPQYQVEFSIRLKEDKVEKEN